MPERQEVVKEATAFFTEKVLEHNFKPYPGTSNYCGLPDLLSYPDGFVVNWDNKRRVFPFDKQEEEDAESLRAIGSRVVSDEEVQRQQEAEDD